MGAYLGRGEPVGEGLDGVLLDAAGTPDGQAAAAGSGGAGSRVCGGAVRRELVLLDVSIADAELSERLEGPAEIYALDAEAARRAKLSEVHVPAHGAFVARLLPPPAEHDAGASLWERDACGQVVVPAEPAPADETLRSLGELEDELVALREDWFAELLQTCPSDCRSYVSFVSLASRHVRMFCIPEPASGTARLLLVVHGPVLEPHVASLEHPRFEHPAALELLRSAVMAPPAGPWKPTLPPGTRGEDAPGEDGLFPHQRATLAFWRQRESAPGTLRPLPEIRFAGRRFAGYGDEAIVGTPEVYLRKSLAPEVGDALPLPAGGLIAHPVGAGKTVIAAHALRGGHARGADGRRTLVACPEHITSQWLSVFVQHAPDVSAATVDEDRPLDVPASADVVVIGYEMLTRSGDEAQAARALLWGENWHRVIFDEPQEAASQSCFDDLVMLPDVRFRWGLTATPEVKAPRIIALLWGRVLDRKTYGRVRAHWGDACAVRDPPAACLPVPPLSHHAVPVTLTEKEMSIVRLFTDIGASMDRVVRKCCFFADQDTDSFSSGSTEAQAFLSLADWQEFHEKLLNSRLARLDERTSGLERELAAARAKPVANANVLEREEDDGRVIEGFREDVDDVDAEENAAEEAGQAFFDQTQVELLEGEVRNAAQAAAACRRELRFVADTVQALGPNAATPSECAVCFERLQHKPVTVLRCLHTFCGSCMQHLAHCNSTVRCPMCRAGTPRRDMSTFLLGDLCVSAAAEGTGAAVGGSKVEALVATLRKILAESPDEKALVFAQFTGLISAVSRALVDAGIQNLQLLGSASKRLAALESFQAPDGPRVLLLSYKHHASGINLHCANHVLILHPYCATNVRCGVDLNAEFVPLAEAQAFENQAVGRVLRYPQQRPVHVYRLFAAGTVEQQLVDRLVRLDAAPK